MTRDDRIQDLMQQELEEECLSREAEAKSGTYNWKKLLQKVIMMKLGIILELQ